MKEVDSMFYKNISYSEKTFYGVTFKPGEVAEVPGYINNLHMIVAPAPTKKPTSASSNTTAVTSKKESKKSETSNSEPVTEQQ